MFISSQIYRWTFIGNVIQTIKYGIIWSQNAHFFTTLLVPPNKENYLTKTIKEYFFIKEMSFRATYIDTFGHKMFILSQLYEFF